MITRRRIVDHWRRRERNPARNEARAEPTTGTAVLECIPDPASFDLDAVWDEEWEKAVLAAALKKVQRGVDPKLFQIYDCYVLKQWLVKAVAKTLGVSPSLIYVAKHRMTTLIQQEVKAMETKLI